MPETRTVAALDSAVVVIELTPLGARALFGLPLRGGAVSLA
ncbi:hypothetical protein ACIQUM_02130 [Amycolatopsis azurea]